jgi:hypothetical protein
MQHRRGNLQASFAAARAIAPAMFSPLLELNSVGVVLEITDGRLVDRDGDN